MLNVFRALCVLSVLKFRYNSPGVIEVILEDLELTIYQIFSDILSKTLVITFLILLKCEF